MKKKHMIKGLIWALGISAVVFGLFMWSARLQQVGSKVVATRGIHWHPQIHIFVDGQEHALPQGIGLVGVESPIHTHEDANKGIIHMEFRGRVTNNMVVLNAFFRTWNKDIHTAFGNLYKMTVNGKDSTEYGNHSMRDKEVINLYYTSASDKSLNSTVNNEYGTQ